jgi:hypothetical protein
MFYTKVSNVPDDKPLIFQISFIQATISTLQKLVTEVMRQLALDRTRYQTEIAFLKRKVATSSYVAKEILGKTHMTSPRVVVNRQVDQ